MNPGQIVGSTLTVAVLAIVTLVGVSILGGVFGAADDFGLGSVDEAIEFPGGGEVYEFNTQEPDQVEVRATTETAVGFDGDLGANSYAEVDPNSDWQNGSWSILVVAQPGDLQDGATHNLIAVDNESIVLEWSDGRYHGYVRDNQSAEVSVDGSIDSGLLSFGDNDAVPLALSYNATTDEVTLRRPGETDTSGFTDTSVNRSLSLSWEGTIDEMRVLNESVSSQTYDVFVDDPINPLAGSNHSLRLMFDEGSGSSTRAYYAGGSASMSGQTWTSGVEGPTIQEGVDVEIAENPLRVKVLESGYLDSAPVFYVLSTGTLSQVLNTVGLGTASAIELIPIIMLTIMASIVIAVTARLRN